MHIIKFSYLDICGLVEGKNLFKVIITCKNMTIKNRLGYALHYTPKCSRLLDIGCDKGIFTPTYLKKAKTVYAVDPNKETIAYAKKANKKYGKRLQFVVAPAEKLPFPDSYFDVVTMTDTFEHVADEKKTMSEVYRVLKPQGQLIFSVPHKGTFAFIDAFNMKFYFPKIYKFWKGKNFSKDIYKEAPWHRHYNLKELKGFFKNKFEIEEKHRGGLLIYPLFWLIHDAIYTELFNNKAPKILIKTHNFISDVDYSIAYGACAFHIVLKAKSLKKS